MLRGVELRAHSILWAGVPVVRDFHLSVKGRLRIDLVPQDDGFLCGGQRTRPAVDFVDETLAGHRVTFQRTHRRVPYDGMRLPDFRHDGVKAELCALLVHDGVLGRGFAQGVGGVGGAMDAVRLRVEAFRERDRAWVGGFHLLGRQYDDFRYPVIAPERVAANCALGPDGVVAILPRLLHRLRSDRPSPIQAKRILEHQVSAGDTLEWREVVRPTGQGVIPMLLLPRCELIPYFAVCHPNGVRLESQIDVRFRKFEHLVPVLILQCLRDFWMRPAFFFGHLDHQLAHSLKRLFRALVVVTRNVRTPAMSVHRGSESVSFLQWLRQLAIHPEYVCILRLALCVWNLSPKEVASRVPIPFRDFPARLCVERPERCAREHRLASFVSATDEVLHRSIGVGVRSSGYGCPVSHALRRLHVPALHGGKVFAILLGGDAVLQRIRRADHSSLIAASLPINPRAHLAERIRIVGDELLDLLGLERNAQRVSFVGEFLPHARGCDSEQVALLLVLLGLRFGGVLGVLGDLFSGLASFALGDVGGGFGYQVERRGIAL